MPGGIYEVQSCARILLHLSSNPALGCTLSTAHNPNPCPEHPELGPFRCLRLWKALLTVLSLPELCLPKGLCSGEAQQGDPAGSSCSSIREGPPRSLLGKERAL